MSQKFAAPELCTLDLSAEKPTASIVSIGEPKLVDLFEGTALRITERFSNLERSCISVPDEQLFMNAYRVIIDVDHFAPGTFVFPLTNAAVASAYGKRGSRMHNGIDLKTLPRDTIRAAFAGIVRVSLDARGFGNVVVIRHYNGLETLYAHNSKNFVKSGDRVAAGESIALTGRTGRASGDHLHLETRFNGEPFDPNLLINFATHSLQSNCLVFSKNEGGKVLVSSTI
jgi:murein DD-endopeptidase MepM/ murein hydrolase activator NlpD